MAQCNMPAFVTHQSNQQTSLSCSFTQCQIKKAVFPEDCQHNRNHFVKLHRAAQGNSIPILLHLAEWSASPISNGLMSAILGVKPRHLGTGMCAALCRLRRNLGRALVSGNSAKTWAQPPSAAGVLHVVVSILLSLKFLDLMQPAGPSPPIHLPSLSLLLLSDLWLA